MASKLSLVQREPARIGGAITGAVSAILILLVAFGVQITDAQQTAILGAVGAIIVLAGALGVNEWVRSRVKPVAKIEAEAEEQ